MAPGDPLNYKKHFSFDTTLLPTIGNMIFVAVDFDHLCDCSVETRQLRNILGKDYGTWLGSGCHLSTLHRRVTPRMSRKGQTKCLWRKKSEYGGNDEKCRHVTIEVMNMHRVDHGLGRHYHPMHDA